MPFDVIEMGVAGEHDLDVGGLEAQLRDVVLDDVVHLVHAGVDQDMSLRRGDQVRGDVRCTDVVDVAYDPERLGRLAVQTAELLVPLPGVLRGSLLRRRDARGDDQSTCQESSTHDVTSLIGGAKRTLTLASRGLFSK